MRKILVGEDKACQDFGSWQFYIFHAARCWRSAKQFREDEERRKIALNIVEYWNERAQAVNPYQTIPSREWLRKNPRLKLIKN